MVVDKGKRFAQRRATEALPSGRSFLIRQVEEVSRGHPDRRPRTVVVIEASYFSVASLICDAALRKHASQLLTAGHLIWVSAFDPIFDCRMRVILDDQPGWDR